MQYPTTKIVFDRRHQASMKSEGYVEVMIYYGNKTKWLSTGIKLYANQWKDREGVVCCMDAESLNERLALILNKINRYINNLIALGKEFDWGDFERAWGIKSKGVETFDDFVKRYMIERSDIRESTRKGHHRLLKAMKDFGGFGKFQNINKQLIIKFDDFLRTKKVNGKKLEASAIWSYHKIVKSYINEAIKRDLMEQNPYASIRVDKGAKDYVEYLTEEEIEKIKSAALNNESIEKVRDMCLIQYYTGVAFADLKELRPENVIEENGRKAIMAHRQKTGVSFYTVLLPEAVEILERNGWKMDMMTNQQYNMRLKILGEKCEISRNLTSHLFRRSAGMFYLNAGMPIEVVSRVLGHSNIKTTQRAYAKILNKTVNAEFEKLIKRSHS